jgi:hypothetical protein
MTKRKPVNAGESLVEVFMKPMEQIRVAQRSLGGGGGRRLTKVRNLRNMRI